jgi:hypothetical protein
MRRKTLVILALVALLGGTGAAAGAQMASMGQQATTTMGTPSAASVQPAAYVPYGAGAPLGSTLGVGWDPVGAIFPRQFTLTWGPYGGFGTISSAMFFPQGLGLAQAPYGAGGYFAPSATYAYPGSYGGYGLAGSGSTLGWFMGDSTLGFNTGYGSTLGAFVS